MQKLLKMVAECPYLNLAAGVILLVTAGYETWDSLEEAKLGAHHGVALFGLLQVIKSLPDIVEAAHNLRESQDELAEA